jgi:hypothetical protein
VTPEPGYSVIGVRRNGERIVISTHATREAADRVVKLLDPGAEFRRIHIEGEYRKRVRRRKRT